MLKDLQERGCVYFFRHIGLSPVKIGYSTNSSPINRLEQFKTYAPFGVELIGFFTSFDAKKIETELHIRYSEKRLKGEWFEINEEEVNKIINFYRDEIESEERYKNEMYFAKKLENINLNIKNSELFSLEQNEKFKVKYILNKAELIDKIGFENFSLNEFKLKSIYKNNLYLGKQKKGYKLFFIE